VTCSGRVSVAPIEAAVSVDRRARAGAPDHTGDFERGDDTTPQYNFSRCQPMRHVPIFGSTMPECSATQLQ